MKSPHYEIMHTACVRRPDTFQSHAYHMWPQKGLEFVLWPGMSTQLTSELIISWFLAVSSLSLLAWPRFSLRQCDGWWEERWGRRPRAELQPRTTWKRRERWRRKEQGMRRREERDRLNICAFVWRRIKTKNDEEGGRRINVVCGWERVQWTEIERDEKKEFAPVLLLSLAWRSALLAEAIHCIWVTLPTHKRSKVKATLQTLRGFSRRGAFFMKNKSLRHRTATNWEAKIGPY